MKVIRLKNYDLTVHAETVNQKNCNVYVSWKRIIRFIQPVLIILFAILALYTQSYYQIDAKHIFSSDMSIAINILLFLLLVMAIMFFVIVIMVVIHELAHLLCFPKHLKNSIIIVGLPLTISAEFGIWIKRKDKLISLIFPVITIQMVIIVISLIFHNGVLFLWLSLMNVALSSSDIHAFLYVLKNVPANSSMFGNYYRCQ